MHTHPAGVIYVLADGRGRTTAPDGTSSEVDLKVGASWSEGITHAWETVGPSDAKVLITEIKSNADARQPSLEGCWDSKAAGSSARASTSSTGRSKSSYHSNESSAGHTVHFKLTLTGDTATQTGPVDAAGQKNLGSWRSSRRVCDGRGEPLGRDRHRRGRSSRTSSAIVSPRCSAIIRTAAPAAD
jgi:hypothetical protein